VRDSSERTDVELDELVDFLLRQGVKVLCIVVAATGIVDLRLASPWIRMGCGRGIKASHQNANVEVLEGTLDLFKHGAVTAGEVGDDVANLDLGVLFLELALGCLELFLGAADQDNVEALLGKLLGVAETNTVRRARHDRILAVLFQVLTGAEEGGPDDYE